MTINKDDFEMAKWILDQAIYQNTALDLRDAMLIRAFLSALEEHEERPAENVRSREWRSMVYRKLLEDPTALHQFTEEALRKYTPEELAGFLHPSIFQAVKEQLPSQPSLEESLANISSNDLFDLLKDAGHLPDFIDHILEHDPDYVKERFGWARELDIEVEAATMAGYDQGREEGREEGLEEGHTEGYNEGFEEGLTAG